MKRMMGALLCLILALSLAACGGGQTPEASQAPELAPVPAAAPAAPEVPAAVPEEGPGAEEEAAAPAYDEAAYQAARDCVGRSLEELYAAVGEPAGGADYAASCLVEDGEDGMLYYDGFYVWTVKTDTEELVHEVYLNE